MASPEMVPSTQQERRYALSQINGRGLWASWKRNFTSPELALLDLIDNSIDATLIENFAGEIHICKNHRHGLLIWNNSYAPIPPPDKVLELFRSHKPNQQIGENGVGIKQACACLSNLSLFLTKNDQTLGLGLLNQNLQTEHSICLPTYTFAAKTVHHDITTAISTSPELRTTLEQFADGQGIQTGLSRILARFDDLRASEHQHVFCVILNRIIHQDSDGDIEKLLTKLRDTLPLNYIHIPNHLKVFVCNERLAFNYWERHLVGLTHFTLKVDSHIPVHLAANCNDTPPQEHLREYNLFIGHRPPDDKKQKDSAEQQNDKTSLYIYSRRSGRLIKHYPDARSLLKLPCSGSDYTHGLTMILDDHNGLLSLTPTKQDIAFGHEATGQIHCDNLFGWIGCHAQACYSRNLIAYAAKQKTILGTTVKSHLSNVKRSLQEQVSFPLATCNFDTLTQLKFKRTNKGTIRCTNHNHPQRYLQRPGTLIRMTPNPPKKKTRYSSTARKTAPDSTFAVDRSLMPFHAIYNSSDDDTSPSSQHTTTPARTNLPIAAKKRPPPNLDNMQEHPLQTNETPNYHKAELKDSQEKNELLKQQLSEMEKTISILRRTVTSLSTDLHHLRPRHDSPRQTQTHPSNKLQPGDASLISRLQKENEALRSHNRALQQALLKKK